MNGILFFLLSSSSASATLGPISTVVFDMALDPTCLTCPFRISARLLGAHTAALHPSHMDAKSYKCCCFRPSAPLKNLCPVCRYPCIHYCLVQPGLLRQLPGCLVQSGSPKPQVHLIRPCDSAVLQPDRTCWREGCSVLSHCVHGDQ